MKKNLASLDTALSRDEAKRVSGGKLDDGGGGGGGCCAHNSDWSWQYCGSNLTLSEAHD